MTNNDSVRLTEPVVIYTARSNNDAHLLAALLRDAGVSAVAVDDMSAGGFFAFGTLGYLHRPQVFVEQVQAEQAAEFITEFETNRKRPSDGEFCYYCGASIATGTTECPECNQVLEGD
jgi:hypothetical protein